MLVKKLADHLCQIGEEYKKKKARGPAYLFYRLVIAVLEWSKAEKIKDIDAASPLALSLPARIVDCYSHIRKERELACDLLRLALNQSPFEDYLKTYPIPPKIKLPWIQHESSNPDRVSDEGEWDGSWDNIVSQYEDDNN